MWLEICNRCIWVFVSIRLTFLVMYWIETKIPSFYESCNISKGNPFQSPIMNFSKFQLWYRLWYFIFICFDVWSNLELKNGYLYWEYRSFPSNSSSCKASFSWVSIAKYLKSPAQSKWEDQFGHYKNADNKIKWYWWWCTYFLSYSLLCWEF